MLKVKRYFLEIDPLGFNNKNIDPPQNVRITLDIKKDFNINLEDEIIEKTLIKKI